MTPIRTLLSDAVRYGLAAGVVGITGLASASAFAQATTTTPPAPDTTKAKNLDRVEVVGSRIKRAVDTEPTQPVTTMTRQDIEQTGLTSTFDLLNHLSASDGSGLSTVTTQTNGSDGSTFISLRNLGPQRTLILVDGKRWVGNGSGAVDLGSIPVSVIERIDVLKDGASAIYGSDAIAGVINIITRKKYDGAQLGWYYGETSHGDGAVNTTDVTIGANGERSNAVISLSRTNQQAIFAGSRSISAFQHAGCAQITSNPPTSDPNGLAHLCGSFVSEWGVFYVPGFDANDYLSLNHSKDGSSFAPGTKPSDFHVFNNADRYNFAPVNYLQQPATRNNLYASGNFEITDNVSAYARVSYTNRRSAQQLAQVPADWDTTGGFGPQWQFGVSPNSVFNPFGSEDMIGYLREVGVGPRHYQDIRNTIGSTVGVQGSFTLGDHNFDWDVYGQYNDSDHTRTGDNFLNLAHYALALGPSFADAGGLHCGTPGAIVSGCVPFDVFNGPGLGLGNKIPIAGGGFYTVTAADVAAMEDYVRTTEVDTDSDKGINFGANLSGEIAPLQGGQLSFATGVETRRERFANQPDSLVLSGGSSDNAAGATAGSTKVDEYYLELDAPVLKDVPGAKELEFDAAARKSKYSSDGSVNEVQFDQDPGNPLTKKFSVRWKPIDDLLVRGSYGDTFRAPQVTDLFAGQSENFPEATDPCNNTLAANGKSNWANLSPAGQALCTAQGVPIGGVAQPNAQIRTLTGGNPLLNPEHGKNLTYGLVFSPSFVPGLNVTVDYWRINLNNVIETLGAQSFLTKCYVELDLPACAAITRQPNGQISLVQAGELNAAALKTDGVDFGTTYKHDTAWGTFGAKWEATYVRHNEFQQDVTAPFVDQIGEYVENSPSFKWRSNLTLDWTRGDWDASWTMRYMSKQDESCNLGLLICNHPTEISSQKDVSQNGTIVGFNRLGAVTYHDVQLGWKAPWKAHISIGARNVFGKEPPLTGNSFANSFDASYDLPGGPFYYLQYRQDF